MLGQGDRFKVSRLLAALQLVILILISLYQEPEYLAASPTKPLTPFADIHTHYKWDQQELIQPETVIERLKAENIVLTVVSGVPTDFALKLRAAGGDWVIPLFSPYVSNAHRNSWYQDPELVQRARKALLSGQYFGIGELHLWSGLPPSRSNKVLEGLFELAAEYDVPFLLHTETSHPDYVIPICKQHSKVRILWAHAGGKLGPEAVERVMQACANLWVELSARDPWRYDSLLDEEGNLPEVWRALFIKYPERFMTGSDPVWSVTRAQSWDQPDEGWDHLSQLIAFHRNWLAQLPATVEEKIRLTNALEFFRVTLDNKLRVD